MKTTIVPVSAPTWYVIDADGQTLGHIASKVAHMLRGKHKSSFSPHQLCGDEIVIINAGKMAVEQRKLLQKEYVTHSGYLGHIKSMRMSDMLIQHPDRIIERAVQGMLPKNRLRGRMLNRLHVFADAEHKHAAQKPVPLPL
jgi:large subunit ribosomal protein L13